MIWGLLGLILVVVLLALAVTRKNLGRALPLAAVIILAIIGFFAWYQDHEMKLSKQSISTAEVELANMQLAEGERDTREISGRIRNHSTQFTLVELGIQVSLEDCVDGRCEVINQTDFTLKLNVPPGQARDFRERIHFRSTPALRGQLQSRYEVLTTRGE